ncbi:hypothetical protein BD324DRAFT_36158 [Kockovaella imperatae]|uniref:Uncharacterized protein n=1 Tax=Kockovaella imperatae TaxID=4999 RepID=A0A1Y1USY4_9TREE|nr:hypothetical protein BD324DRAFT_36158 [Kockovaella imperatae]ORX41062.1 hypothetical protein BD324DRAFT_36158 [Kockovaella imperatae]
MCELVPSVTLYGTTQIQTVVSLTSTSTFDVTMEPQVHLTTNLNGVPCPPGQQDCQFSQTALVTDTPVYQTTKVITTSSTSLITQVIPQKTLYYPCSSTGAGDGGENAAQVETSADDHPPQTFSEAVSSFATPASSAVPTTTNDVTASVIDSLQSVSTKPAVGHSSSQKIVSPSASSTILANPTSESLIVASATRSNLFSSITSSFPSGGTAVQNNQDTSGSSGANVPIIAGIVGGIGVLVLLISFCLWCRRRTRLPVSRDSERDASSISTDFWERRFRQIEAEGDGEDVQHGAGMDEKVVAEGGGVERVGSKKIRLTLDLGSKDLPSRPVSTLSAISSFFRSHKGTALPSRASPTDTNARPLNFSRPRFGQKRGCSSSTPRPLSSSTSRSRSSHRTQESVKSLSRWLGNSSGFPFASRIPSSSSSLSSPPRVHQELVGSRDLVEGSTSQRSEEDPEYLDRSYDPNDPTSARNPFNERQYAPPRMTTDEEPVYPLQPNDGTNDASDFHIHPGIGINWRRLTPGAAPSLSSKYTTSDMSRSTMTSESFSLPMMSIPQRSTVDTMSTGLVPISGCQTPPPAPAPPPSAYTWGAQQSASKWKSPSTCRSSYNTGSEVSISASRPVTREYVGIPTAHRDPSISFNPSRDTAVDDSQSDHVVSSSVIRRPPPPPPPPLQFSREAITPSLWVDEDAYDRFRECQGRDITSLHLSDDSLSIDPAIDRGHDHDRDHGSDDRGETRQVRFRTSKETFGHISQSSSSSSEHRHDSTSPRSIASSYRSQTTTATETSGASITSSKEASDSSGPNRLKRSAVTPQLPPLNLGGSTGMRLGTVGDETEEKIMSVYVAKSEV